MSIRHEPRIPGVYIAQLLEGSLISPPEKQRAKELVERSGHTLEDLSSPGVQVPLAWAESLTAPLTAEQAAWLGYRFGEESRLTSHERLSLPFMSASTVRDAIQVLRFLPLLTNCISASLLESHEGLLVFLEPSTGSPILDRVPLFYGVAALNRLIGLITGKPSPLLFSLRGAPPEFLRGIEYEVSPRIQFGAPANYILVPWSFLDEPCLFADPVTYKASYERCAKLMAALDDASGMAIRVREYLDAQPVSTGLDAVAEHFHMSPSTLKRHLQASGTRFSKIHDASQLGKAVSLLMESKLSLQAIAEKLGYSDTANFSHAFKKWTGQPPGSFRRGVGPS